MKFAHRETNMERVSEREMERCERENLEGRDGVIQSERGMREEERVD